MTRFSTQAALRFALFAGLAILIGSGTTGCETTDGSGGGGFTVKDLGTLVETGAIIAGKDQEDVDRYRTVTESIAGAAADVSPEKEWEIGGGVALKSVAAVGPVHPDDQLQRYVNLVGRTVARQGSRPHLPYTFTVLESPEVNAFAAPGGYVFLTTGALALMEDESELAGVLAHEVAHVSERHLIIMFKRQRWFSAMVTTSTALKDNLQEYSQLGDLGNQVLLKGGIDRDFEYDADMQGTELAAMAGYDPSGLQRFLVKLGQATHRQGGWLSTHPSTPSRLEKLNAVLSTDLAGEGGVRNKERFRQQCADRLGNGNAVLLNDVRKVLGAAPVAEY